MAAPYKPTHDAHPSVKWARESSANLAYLENLFLALCDEYTYRYGKVHACETKWKEYYHIIQRCINERLPNTPFTYPPLCMPDEYKTACHVESYRLYYLGDKARMLKWKNRDTPYWVRGAVI
jgi:hypothetical protein